MKKFFLFILVAMCAQATAFSQGIISKSLYFSPNKADLTLEGVVKLHKLADTLVNYPTYRITIAACSDKDPKNPAYRLAQARVKLVEDYLKLLMLRPYDQRAFYDNTAMPIYPYESDASGINRKNRIDIWVQYALSTPPSSPKPAAPASDMVPKSINPTTEEVAPAKVEAAPAKTQDGLPSLDSRGEEVKGPKGKSVMRADGSGESN